MGRLISKLSNGTIIEYDRGKFDDWCVYLTKPNSKRYAPTDIQYFTFFQGLNKDYNSEKVYNDFVAVFDITTKNIEADTLKIINGLSQTYGKYSEDFEIWLTVVYAGMVAEENKAFTKLGKRIKRLGMHQVILEDVIPNKAAFFSKGMGWRDIDKHCKKRGF